MPSELILLEGLDGTGKTTAAKHIARNHGYRTAILHDGPPMTLSAHAEYVNPLHGLARSSYVVICDRWLLGEMVWAPLYGRESIVHQATLDLAEIQIRDMFDKVTCCYLDRPLKDIRKVRELDYDPIAACALYNEAMYASSFEWTAMSMHEASRL